MKTLLLVLLLIPSLVPCPDGVTSVMQERPAATSTHADADSMTDGCGMCPCACCGHGGMAAFGPDIANPHSIMTLDLLQSLPYHRGAQFLPWRPPAVL